MPYVRIVFLNGKHIDGRWRPVTGKMRLDAFFGICHLQRLFAVAFCHALHACRHQQGVNGSATGCNCHGSVVSYDAYSWASIKNNEIIVIRVRITENNAVWMQRLLARWNRNYNRLNATVPHVFCHPKQFFSIQRQNTPQSSACLPGDLSISEFIDSPFFTFFFPHRSCTYGELSGCSFWRPLRTICNNLELGSAELIFVPIAQYRISLVSMFANRTEYRVDLFLVVGSLYIYIYLWSQMPDYTSYKLLNALCDV